ncbi:MAG TPA: nucleotidyltransferase family protein [Candidatus Nitrosotenuis sp.]|nr:nucleotidyltransferase family protein [Candidatus Nitrosotenuis sp.]
MDSLLVLVLAAGKSTRIHPVTGGLPKPLLPLAGLTVLERNLRWLAASGLTSAWVNLHQRPEAIRQVVGEGQRCGLLVRYSHEPEILGTAGALRNLPESTRRTSLVVYGDNLVRFDLSALLATHCSRGAEVTLALFDPCRHLHTGIAGGRAVLDEEGRLRQFVEGAGQGLVNAGVYLVEPSALDSIPPGGFCDFARDLFPRLLAQGRHLQGHVIDGYCLGLDTPEAYARALELVASGQVPLA